MNSILKTLLPVGLSLGSTLIPEGEAEAFWVDKVKPLSQSTLSKFKLSNKEGVFLGEIPEAFVSTADSLLKGVEVQGKKILRVLRDPKVQDLRTLIFENPRTGSLEEMSLDRDALTTLVSKVSNDMYVKNLFPEKSVQGKYNTILKSVGMREGLEGAVSTRKKDVLGNPKLYQEKSFKIAEKLREGTENVRPEDVPEIVTISFRHPTSGKRVYTSFPRAYATFVQEYLPNSPTWFRKQFRDFSITQENPLEFEKFARKKKWEGIDPSISSEDFNKFLNIFSKG